MNAHDFDGDQSIKSSAEDRLGFCEVAQALANAIAGISSDKSFIFGLEGKWGSGKSSLLALTEEALQDLPEVNRPIVIRFRPWLVGSRDALLSYLFSELNKAITAVEKSKGNIGAERRQQAKRARKALRQFASGIGKIGGIIEVAGDASGFAPVRFLGQGFKSLQNLGEEKAPKLEDLKAALIEALRNLDVKFLVTIDDVDRLEPDEIVEILRLAKSVADLPNVSYLLCYDSDILAQSVQSVGNIDDGKTYLEKILQLTINVPTPEPFQLRNWFASEVGKELEGYAFDAERLRTVIDFEGGRQLRTPRSVKKTLDSIRFVLPSLIEVGIDFADLVWVVLVKDGNHDLYRWIEKYSSTVAALSMGYASVSEEEKKAEREKLFSSVPDGQFDDLMYRSFFSSMLPGVDMGYDAETKLTICGKYSDTERDRAIRERRLSSPDHYRYYFAFAPPTHALRQRDVGEFWNACEQSAEAVGALLVDWHETIVANGLSKADVLFERLSVLNVTEKPSQQLAHLLIGLSNCMDRIFQIRPIKGFEFFSFWGRVEKFIRKLVAGLDGDARFETVRLMFAEGQAIGWLTDVIRRETFAHGVYGKKPKPEEQWYISADEFSEASAAMLRRYRQLSFDELKTTPRPISLLFAWAQLGDAEGPKALLGQKLEDDEGFIEVLELLTNTIGTSMGETNSFSVDNVAPFLDYDNAITRLKNIADGDGELRVRARKLTRAVEEAF